MSKTRKVFAVVSLLLLFQPLVFADITKDDPKVKAIVEKLKQTGSDSVLVSAVIAQNAKKLSMADINSRDKKWQETSGVDDFMKQLMENSAASRLAKIEKETGPIIESFLMDNQGANVAMTNKTSDYWQGDEAKFKQSYKNGAGGVHVGKTKFDKSAQAYVIQISVPVMDNGKVIGAITYGVNVDDL